MIKSIQVYDPPMCCSTGICGPDIDPELVEFASVLSQLAAQGVEVTRFNLGQQPMAFVENAVVKGLLDTDGVEVLPVIFWDGEVKRKGSYPNASERASWLHEGRSLESATS